MRALYSAASYMALDACMYVLDVNRPTFIGTGSMSYEYSAPRQSGTEKVGQLQVGRDVKLNVVRFCILLSRRIPLQHRQC